MRKTTRLVLRSAVLSGALLCVAPAAWAQGGGKAAAEALFQAGRDLMGQGKYNEACAKFEASQRVDAGLGTLLYLADCYEKANRLASAWATFREAESIAKGRADQERADVARQRSAALEPRLAKMSIKVADGNDAATEVKRDGDPVPRESWGISIPVDAGEHKLEATAPGYKPWSKTVRVEGEAIDVPVEVPVLAVDDTPKPAAGAAAPEPPPPSKDQGSEGSPGSGQRTVGLIVGGVGIVGIGVGTFFGLRAKSKKDQSLANDHCPNDRNICDEQGTTLRNQALSAATVSTIAMIAGGAALVGGVVLFLTAPSGKSESGGVTGLRVAAGADGIGSARVTLGGAF